MSDYNGWTNWETWNLNLWLGNNYETDKEIERNAPHWTAEEAESYALSVYPHGTPDMMGHGDGLIDMNDVNYQELADAWNEE